MCLPTPAAHRTPSRCPTGRPSRPGGPNGVDGGSEFQAELEQACAERWIRLFVLPPHSPKLNGHVERAQRTHKEEFHAYYDGALDLKSQNKALRR